MTPLPDLEWIASADLFFFTVQACEQAIVILSQVPGQLSSEGVIITLGAEKNTVTTMQQLGKQNRARAETPGILSCASPRAFWLQWRQNRLKLGHGSYGDADGTYFIHLDLVDELSFRGVSLAGPGGIERRWEVFTTMNGTDSCTSLETLKY